LDSLVDGVSRFIMTTIVGGGSTEVHANLLTEICQSVDLQNQCKQPDEGEISNMTEVQNPYKLPLNSELTAFIERADESANNVIGYQYSFDHDR
jgi:adenylylsulfate kinase-like enzyme